MLQAIAFWVMILSGSGLVALFVNSMWKRYIRLKALEPGLDREWVADCAKHGSATFKGSKVSLKNVRDFSWKNKREHDSKWINTKVDIDEIVDVCNKIANSGIRVIIAGLDMDYLGNPFGPMPNLMAISEYVTKVHAVCKKSGNVANYSYRKNKKKDIVVIGEKDKYEPLSRAVFYKKMKKNKSK